MRAFSRRAWLRGALGLGLTSAAGGAYALGLEPGWVEVRPVTLRLPRLDPAFHGYRIAHLSDLHLGDWLDRRRLMEIVGLTNRQRPDLVAITGDFVTRRPDLVASDLVAALDALRAPDGVAAVLGNHDHWSDPGLLRRAIRAGGAVELPNRTHTLERGRALLHIAGVDDVWEKRARL
jgi:predicted MPP superfamily phosphohydrolase